MSEAAAAAPEGVWAVVTVFRPDIVPPVIEQVRTQVDGVVVVDDGSGDAYAGVLDEIARSGTILVRQPHNAGIGAALNRGVDRAMSLGAVSVVTFDQDSEIPPAYVSELRGAHDVARAHGFTAGPVVPEHFAGVHQAGRRVNPAVVLASHAIQSGMYIPLDVWARVGSMDEGLFIDLVDIDFELRCADAGLPCIIAPGVRLEHRLGARYRASGPLGPLLPVLTLSAPFRYYYRARNRIIINRRHTAHRSRLVREGLADQAYFLIALVVARPRRDMWDIIRSGKRDGRRGRSGAIPSPLAERAADISWRAERQPE